MYVPRTVLEVIYGKKKSSVIFQGVAWNSEKLSFLVEQLFIT